MDKEEIAVRIEELIKKYKNKKDELDDKTKEYEKIQKNRKVRMYIELSEIISNSKKELFSIIEDVTKLQEKYKGL